MSNSLQEKYGFVYIWYDRHHKRYYIGCHWGFEDDGYICSSTWMRNTLNRRPADFKRRIIKRIYTNRQDLFVEEQRYLNMIKPEEIKPLNENPKYYNLHITVAHWVANEETRKTVGQKISQSKKGKSTGPCSEEKAAKISEAKKEAFRKRKEETGSYYDKETSERMKQTNIKTHTGTTHTDKRKKQKSEMLKQQWANGERVSIGQHSDETKLKMSLAHKGKKLKQDQIDLLKVNNSKSYIITFKDGREETINGLKLYATENNIPYVSLYKASQNKKSIHKYNILSIQLI